MSSQFISDSIEREDMDVPEWHKETVRQRLTEYINAQDIAVDFDEAIDDIEKDL
jgi:hypothetical protein